MKIQVLGLPRIGVNRELKKTIEAFWQNKLSLSELEETARNIRKFNLNLQKQMDFDLITVGDFSYYDQVLDMTVTLGAIPERFNWNGEDVELSTYFSLPRGSQDAYAMEMTKWFDTNYHYIVPEFYKNQTFKLTNNKILNELKEAQELGFSNLKPVMIGPLTYIFLGKSIQKDFDKWELLDTIIDVYIQLLQSIAPHCNWIQIDEPILTLELPKHIQQNFIYTYKKIKNAIPNNNIMLATYFEDVLSNKDIILSLPVESIHLDLVRGWKQVEFVSEFKDKFSLSLGVINGRNIWKSDLNKIIKLVESIGIHLDNNTFIAPSCSLLHVPIDLDCEQKLNPELKSWMAFAVQKCRELRILKQALNGQDVASELAQNQQDIQSRAKSQLRTNPLIQEKMKAISPEMFSRTPYKQRKVEQQKLLDLPLLPTTTIGSFPQTKEIRQTRLKYKKGELSETKYKTQMKKFIDEIIEKQEKIGLDVLVHGEPERSDMVEYFGLLLEGFCTTENGWVQSYGTRCVKPPIIYGDIVRSKPMTVEWITYAQSRTKKPVKGMLTGPITLLCWSFVRDDQPRKDTAFQLALAIREEVQDLEKAGIKIIQIDEPALKEGMPLKGQKQKDYLNWAVKAFRLATSGVKEQTQIHTHMCYSEFEDIIEWIAKMDADVISIEASRSKMSLLEVFKEFNYPNEIGPGIYDIHSPRIPSVEEMKELIKLALEVIPQEKLWINPDCGLKTRNWPETIASLKNMVQAALSFR
ncbi:MAG: 5-methyltetrahydropteroyltriglutamate--homocysteine S-methyltransferase [Desulfonauticus sp.]|nr:5-methyltetrahydropteroyltriglutamate--homocysteine S-methyltransferase [Desulfonauticus sp.]